MTDEQVQAELDRIERETRDVFRDHARHAPNPVAIGTIPIQLDWEIPRGAVICFCGPRGHN